MCLTGARTPQFPRPSTGRLLAGLAGPPSRSAPGVPGSLAGG